MLEKMDIAFQLRGKISAAEFAARFPDENNQHIELLEGEIIMTSPSPQHQMISNLLAFLLNQVIIPQALGQLISAPSDVHFDEHNVLQPDLFFIAKDSTACQINARNQWAGAPDLCLEILSPTSIKYDRETKFQLYAQFGVAEYWIVDANNLAIEIYVLENGAYARLGIFTADDPLKSQVLPQLDLLAKTIFS